MHIMVGADESAAGHEALRWALGVVRRSGGTVELVRAWMYSALPLQQLLAAPEMDRLTREGLEAMVAAHDTSGLAVRTTVARGPAHHALLSLIAKERPSLVVVGRRGETERAAPRVLGSVSRRLVDASPSPVVVVSETRAGDFARDEPTVLVAIDGSEHCERALHWAAGFAGQVGASALLAHVVGFAGSVGEVATLSDAARTMLDNAAGFMSSRGVTSSTVTAFGDPRRELERIADDHEVDLIVIGPRGTGGLGKLLVGSVASYLTEYAERPVAVVPAGVADPSA